MSRPYENELGRVYSIHRSRHADHPGESAGEPSHSYPCAAERDDHLYVGYSNNGARLADLNSTELAVVRLSQLRVD
ncbi:MAG: hypothetical protein AAF961_01575 [Planctomycetota bacterium]